jgi:hypothetical protein
MPPASFHKKLTTDEKALLTRWVKEGGKYQKHWSYEPPVKAAVPTGVGAIDYLVQKRLTQIGLRPSPPADRRTLIRRLYFDLTGLPPSPEEADSFLNDGTPGAYSKLVEKLLANPHYGERMAQSWLDVARFADTIGYHSDTPRNIWPYRDYVINSFNANKPFDRFTREQIAGDLLPDASQETRIGSAFNRLLLTTEEGGAQAKDYEARYLTDRVRAIGTVFLGQTTGCCQCHDHKFDPYTQRDFYSLGAYFADVDEAIIGGGREPGLLLASAEQSAELTKEADRIAELEKQLNGPHPELAAAQAAWEKNPQGKIPDEITAILKIDTAQRSADQTAKLAAYYRSIAPELASLRAQVAEAKKARGDYEGAIPRCIVTSKNAKPRTVRILKRGNFMDESGDIVQAHTPAFLPGAVGGGRLELANWLVSKENPLTARAVMNRLWRQLFGGGISKVVEDMGAQGEPPSNPELLDWLACEFRDSGWDYKHMIRLIVYSATYKQSSTPTKEQIARDPLNREFARQGRFRLEAEEIRDNALAVAGLLSAKIGGPSVFPYQPERYWENLNFPVRDWAADKGESQYRRGMYTWWQRTFVHPSMLAFDASTREECCAARNQSNIPQQALVLLNDPTYVEAARAFAARILRINATDGQRIDWAVRQALTRTASSDEQATLCRLLDRQLAAYRADGAAADNLLKTGFSPIPPDLDKTRLAAWTHVARVLLNLHESITRS